MLNISKTHQQTVFPNSPYKCRKIVFDHSCIVATGRFGHLLRSAIPWAVAGSAKERGRDSDIPVSLHCTNRGCSLGGGMSHDKKGCLFDFKAWNESIIIRYKLKQTQTSCICSQVLLRARAIETQCFVLAAAQVGRHHEKRSSYGHALVVDPWGEVLGDCGGEEPGMVLVEINLEKVRSTRRNMPVQQHRRDTGFYNSLEKTWLQEKFKVCLNERTVWVLATNWTGCIWQETSWWGVAFMKVDLGQVHTSRT